VWGCATFFVQVLLWVHSNIVLGYDNCGCLLSWLCEFFNRGGRLKNSNVTIVGVQYRNYFGYSMRFCTIVGRMFEEPLFLLVGFFGGSDFSNIFIFRIGFFLFSEVGAGLLGSILFWVVNTERG
jgi:hypothetical protein